MTHIQTEVSDEEYERLQQVADQQGLSIREALRQATELWLEEQEAVDTEDPLFTSVEDVRSTSDATEATALSAEDDIVEEWAGDADSTDLADPSE
jgi:hypothetical protein